MKKKCVCCLAILVLICMIFCLAGYNQSLIDTTYNFDEAIIAMPDGTVIRGKVESWTDYDDSDAIQIKIDGKVYYTFLDNVVLIKNK